MCFRKPTSRGEGGFSSACRANRVTPAHGFDGRPLLQQPPEQHLDHGGAAIGASLASSQKGDVAAVVPPERLPRLALISDVSAERTMGGELLLHRLLGAYPAEKLRIVTSDWTISTGEHVRLPGVRYDVVYYPRPRLIRNKYNPFWPLMIRPVVRLYTRRLRRVLDDFQPEAILTVGHAFLWETAATIARETRCPLYLIAHDDWPIHMTFHRDSRLNRLLRRHYEKIFGKIYCAAREVFCVSPNMVGDYERLYGRRGTLLYPSRGEDSPPAKLRVRDEAGDGKPVIAFAGSPNILGLREVLQLVGRVLEGMGGHLDLYTQYSPGELTRMGLGGPAMRARGFFPPPQLAERVAETAHALLLPASFRDAERAAVRRLFPSKLIDCTAIGIPILIVGPADSSIGRWGIENPSAAVTVTEPDPAAIEGAIRRISTDASFAKGLALASMAQAEKDFDLRRARETLYTPLVGQ